jgi:hypothetical protein
MAVSGQVNNSVSITATSTTGTAGTVRDVMNFGSILQVPTTTGVREWTKAASGTLTLLASTAQEIDLEALVSGTGTLVFAAINYLYFKIETETAAATVTIAKGTTNGWEAPFSASGTITIYGGGTFVLERPLGTGYTVDATHKTVKFTPSAHALTCTYFVAGT